jgi:hypothetical protein
MAKKQNQPFQVSFNASVAKLKSQIPSKAPEKRLGGE